MDSIKRPAGQHWEARVWENAYRTVHSIRTHCTRGPRPALGHYSRPRSGAGAATAPPSIFSTFFVIWTTTGSGSPVVSWRPPGPTSPCAQSVEAAVKTVPAPPSPPCTPIVHAPMRPLSHLSYHHCVEDAGYQTRRQQQPAAMHLKCHTN